MKRRGRNLVDLVVKNVVVEERKALKESTNIMLNRSARNESPVPSGCEQEIDFLLQIEAEMSEGNNNENLADLVVNIEEEIKHVEGKRTQIVEVQEKNGLISSPSNIFKGSEVTEESNISKDTYVATDCPLYEDFSISTVDLDFNSPTSSFAIPTSSSAVSSSVGSPSDCPKRRPGKIRTRNYSEWKDLKRKALKNSGKAFINKKGQIVPGKKIKEPCNCPKKCFQKLEQNCREHIFNCFWDIGRHEKQWEFILKYTRCHKPKRIKAEGPNRTQTRVYSLPINKTETVHVCRKMFLNTLSIGEKTVRTAFKKLGTSTNEHCLNDLRGRHLNRPKKIKEAVIDSVKDHIDSLAPIESHYCRKNSTKKYLDGQLSYKRLHNLYTEWLLHQNYDCEIASLRQYQDIVNKNFNIAFYYPKKDQCDKCHAFFSNKEPTEIQKSEQELHMQRKNLGRTVKAADKSESERNSNIITATFDMQKILTCPYGNVSIFPNI
ncbi:hypothetical protein ACJJTC_014999 [Scirpophaga incertulas]